VIAAGLPRTSEVRRRTGLEAEKPIAETLKDCIAALKTVQYASDRLYLERFVSLLAASIESATSVPFVATDKAQSEVNELLKQIAQGANSRFLRTFNTAIRRLALPKKTIETGVYSWRTSPIGLEANPRPAARLTIAAQRARESRGHRYMAAHGFGSIFG